MRPAAPLTVVEFATWTETSLLGRPSKPTIDPESEVSASSSCSGAEVATLIPGRVVAVAESPESASLAASLDAGCTVVGLAAGTESSVGVSVPRSRYIPTTTATTTKSAPLIAAALFGLDIGPFIGRPPGRLCDGLCVLDAGDHAFALIGAPTAVLQPKLLQNL